MFSSIVFTSNSELSYPKFLLLLTKGLAPASVSFVVFVELNDFLGVSLILLKTSKKLNEGRTPPNPEQ